MPLLREHFCGTSLSFGKRPGSFLSPGGPLMTSTFTCHFPTQPHMPVNATAASGTDLTVGTFVPLNMPFLLPEMSFTPVSSWRTLTHPSKPYSAFTHQGEMLTCSSVPPPRLKHFSTKAFTAPRYSCCPQERLPRRMRAAGRQGLG